MALQTSFVIQPFELVKKKLKPGRQETAPTENGAMKRAEAMARRMPGTAAIKVVADDETGELESALILGQWGDVPEDFAEQMGGG